MSEKVDYFDNETRLEGIFYLAENEKSPVVLVVPSYAGRDEFTLGKAQKLNDLGYSGFAVDMYGEAKTGSTPEENLALMQVVLDDREMLQRRMLLALKAATEKAGVENSRSAAIGFCFGGLCCLDLARTGSDIGGVVSFHGLFTPPVGSSYNTDGPINAKVLALHGNDDPMVPHESVNSLANELTAAKADWQIHAYGNTAHAFTNPAANSPDDGMAFSESADRRSWKTMSNFLEEVFA